MSTIAKFIESLLRIIDDKSVVITQWSGAPRRSKNIIEINSINKSLIIYVKISNNSPGFWGLTKNHLDRLNNMQTHWFVVLLLKSYDCGYILYSNDVNTKIQEGVFELSKDGDHKINERSDLNSEMAFQGINNLMEKILKHG